ncbi:MAG: NAD(P)/FAD-dependent oxidoreductase [Bacteroidetes bacterium]|nr:NAD(P)/FAD-dependent oxidoreductase [Bacteroidota bacterium]
MSPLKLKDSYDVIIIGAGIGGLTAGALLSKSGLSVCIVEKEPHVGGYLAGFRRKDFLFDTAIHWLNQYNYQGIVTRLFDVLGSDHPRAISLKHTRRYKGNTFDYLLTTNPNQLRDQLIAEFPHERKGLLKFFRNAKRIGDSLCRLNQIFRSEETMTFSEKIFSRIRMLSVLMPFIPYAFYSGEKGLKKGLNRFFRDPALHKVFASETELIGCMVPIGWSYADDFQCPPEGGGQVIPEWLKYIVEFYKNDILPRCSVQKILIEDMSCVGVQCLHRGKIYEIRSKYVIAACDIETLYEKMLPSSAVPEILKEKLRNAELYSSSCTISIGLDCPTEALGLGEELIHLVNENISFDAHQNGDPSTAEISILPPSVRDKSLVPEGCGTLTLFMPALMDYCNNWYAVKDEKGEYIRGVEYRELKKKVAEIIIDRVEAAVAPGLKSHILFYEIATPITHYRYTGNKNGTMMGAKPGQKNMRNKIAHYQTPVKNLILGGHWAELGGGVPIAAKAGTNASLIILKKENKLAFSRLCGYLDGKLTLNDLHSSNCFKPYDNSWVRTPTPAERKENRCKV